MSILLNPFALGSSGGGGGDLTSNLISWWDFEEASGSRLDSHGSNDLAISNAAYILQQTGHVGNCVEFNNPSFCQDTTPTDLNASASGFTVAGWIYLDTSGNTTWISYGSTLNYRLFYDTTNGIGWAVRNTSATDHFVYGGTMTLNTWYFIAAGFDGADVFLSVNNGAPSTTTLAGTVQTATGTFMLGAWTGVGSYMNGRLDSLGFWRGRTLSTSDISSLYNGGSGLSYADL